MCDKCVCIYTSFFQNSKCVEFSVIRSVTTMGLVTTTTTLVFVPIRTLDMTAAILYVSY